MLILFIANPLSPCGGISKIFDVVRANDYKENDDVKICSILSPATDAYGQTNNLGVKYIRFLGMISALHVVSDIRNRHGSKYIVDRSEIDRQLQLIEG